jgi:hypothetical protein
MSREIAEAIDRLAAATQVEADATAALVALRERELTEAAKGREERVAADAEAKTLIQGFRDDLTELTPALRMLVVIAKAMRGEMGQ